MVIFQEQSRENVQRVERIFPNTFQNLLEICQRNYKSEIKKNFVGCTANALIIGNGGKFASQEGESGAFKKP